MFKKIFLAWGLILTIALPLSAATFLKVIYNNKTISTKTLTINGVSYIPATDVAKILNADLKYDKQKNLLTLFKSSADVCEVPESGISSCQGKFREWISNGRTRLMVDKMNFTDHYDVYKPLEEGNRFIVLYLTQQNAANNIASLGFDPANSYLADDFGNTYPPHLYKNERRSNLIPGETFLSELVFSLPETITPTLLVLKMIGQGEESIRVVF